MYIYMNSHNTIIQSSIIKCLEAEEIPQREGKMPEVLVTKGFNR